MSAWWWGPLAVGAAGAGALGVAVRYLRATTSGLDAAASALRATLRERGWTTTSMGGDAAESPGRQ